MSRDEQAVAKRDQARSRVKKVTTTTAIAGVLGSVGIVAGMGLASTGATVAATTASTSGTSAASTGSTTTTTASGTSSSGTTSASTLQSAAQQPTTGSGSTQVSSGGS